MANENFDLLKAIDKFLDEHREAQEDLAKGRRLLTLDEVCEIFGVNKELKFPEPEEKISTGNFEFKKGI